VKINSYGNWTHIIDLGNGPSNNNIMIGFTSNTGNLFFRCIDGSNTTYVDISTAVQPSLNQWNHIAATIDSNRKATLYLNGVVIGTAVATALPPVTTRTNNYIGRSNWPADSYLNGSIDELRIYNTARNADTISNDRYNTVNPGDSSLVYAYNFNSVSSNQSPSSLPGASGATLLNGASIGSSAAVDGSPATNNLWAAYLKRSLMLNQTRKSNLISLIMPMAIRQTVTRLLAVPIHSQSLIVRQWWQSAASKILSKVAWVTLISVLISLLLRPQV
jgi:hypothetical protein